MTGYTFDSNIIIDALVGQALARREIELAIAAVGRAWISRMVWIEVLSKGNRVEIGHAERLLGAFDIDEVNGDVAQQAAALRRERPRLKSPDAIILASAFIHGRILVTRNTKDFPASMPGIRVPYTL